MAEFGVSRMTVNRALRELQAEGLVERVAGRGHLRRAAAPRVVHADDPRPARRDRGARPPPPCRRAPAARRARQRRAGRAAGRGRRARAVFHTLIVHHENDVPLQCEDRYVNPACAPGYLDVDFTQTTPTRYLFEATAAVARAVFDRGRARHGAGGPAARRSRADEPCLIVVRRTFTRQRADHDRAAGAPGLALPARGAVHSHELDRACTAGRLPCAASRGRTAAAPRANC